MPVGIVSVVAHPGRGNNINTRTHRGSWREHRTVVLPSYQGCGIGPAIADAVAAAYFSMGCNYTSAYRHPVFYKHRKVSKEWTTKKGLSGKTCSAAFQDLASHAAHADSEASESYERVAMYTSTYNGNPSAPRVACSDREHDKASGVDLTMETDDEHDDGSSGGGGGSSGGGGGRGGGSPGWAGGYHVNEDDVVVSPPEAVLRPSARSAQKLPCLQTEGSSPVDIFSRNKSVVNSGNMDAPYKVGDYVEVLYARDKWHPGEVIKVKRISHAEKVKGKWKISVQVSLGFCGRLVRNHTDKRNP